MQHETILLDHGSGGKIAHELTTGILLPLFNNPLLNRLHDGAVIDMAKGRLAVSTDTFTVDPLFFPGGDIGDLAVNGTVNDVAMCGAVPRYLSLALILEEGLPMSDFKTILTSVAKAAQKTNVTIITGDTKVVPKGAVDKIFINTTGIGFVADGVDIGSHRVCAGDKVILSGTIADHGITIMTRQKELRLSTPTRSDTAPLNQMVAQMIATGRELHELRDPTRGGVGTTLCEIAQSANCGIRMQESAIPVKPEVSGACDLLGFDPLYLANEGKLLAIVPADAADVMLTAIQKVPYGKNAVIIGEVVEDHPGKVVLQTRIGGERMVDMLTGEQLPRIC